MNGKTNIDAILNPCSAEFDRHTWGVQQLNVSFYGHRLVYFRIGRLTVDIYAGSGKAFKTFAAMGGGANGTARYWMLFWPLGKIQWVTRKAVEPV
jgi:hypothetical protein